MDTGSTVINYGRLCQLYSKKDTGIILIWSPGPKESVSADATIVVQAAASCLLWGPAALVSQMSNGSDSCPSARAEAGPLYVFDSRIRVPCAERIPSTWGLWVCRTHRRNAP